MVVHKCLAGFDRGSLEVRSRWPSPDAVGASLSSGDTVSETERMTDLVPSCHGRDFLPDIQGVVELEETRARLGQVIIDGSCNTGFVPLVATAEKGYGVRNKYSKDSVPQQHSELLTFVSACWYCSR